MNQVPRIVAFFNSKAGVGTTTVVYHLAWMLQDLGVPTLAVDLDPQGDLTTRFLEREQLVEIWSEPGEAQTILGAVQPAFDGSRLPLIAHTWPVASQLDLLPGDPALGCLEDRLAQAWIATLEPQAESTRDGFVVTSAIYRGMMLAASSARAAVVLVDVGPNLGALSRAALIAADFVVLPLAPVLGSMRSLRYLGPTLQKWRQGWQERLQTTAPQGLQPLPTGMIEPIGYVLRSPDPPTIGHISRAFHRSVLGEQDPSPPTPDPYLLGTLRNYLGLMPLSQEHRKPIFHLLPADGAIGSYNKAARDSYRDFQQLAKRILQACAIPESRDQG
jgi:cellulose biosynthesis protein BcsQ